MAVEIYEWFGYRAEDQSHQAADAATSGECPFIRQQCTKASHVCSLRQLSGETVPVCPIRLYYDGHHFLREIAHEAFDHFDPNLGSDMLPTVVPGDLVAATAQASGGVQIGVFGKGWAREIQLPAAAEGGARYSVDYTVVAVSPAGELLGFVAVEVQTIDTTGSYGASVTALQNGRQVASSGAGFNWENVSKRILPQLITKGLTLQGERLCQRGIYLVTPEQVFQRIMTRLGGQARFRQIPQQPGSITFIRMEHNRAGSNDGQTVAMRRLGDFTISTSDLSLAFITPQNLGVPGSYEAAIVRNL